MKETGRQVGRQNGRLTDRHREEQKKFVLCVCMETYICIHKGIHDQIFMRKGKWRLLKQTDRQTRLTNQPPDSQRDRIHRGQIVANPPIHYSQPEILLLLLLHPPSSSSSSSPSPPPPPRVINISDYYYFPRAIIVTLYASDYPNYLKSGASVLISETSKMASVCGLRDVWR